MRLNISAAALSGLVAIVFGLAATPADAQTRNRTSATTTASGTRYTVIEEGQRPRTRVIVQQRSFLDGGTEVLPGERKYTDYVFPPGYSPTSVIDNTGMGQRSPLPGPFDLPGRDNPYPWWPN
jgi:hypothetical protein